MDLKRIGDGPERLWCPVCGRDIEEDVPLQMLPFRSEISIDPGAYSLEIGLARPALVLIGTADSQMARDGLTGGIPACDGDCGRSLADHIETIRSAFEN